MVEQAFINMADLFDVEGAKAEPTSLPVHFEILQRPQQVQHRAIVDRQWVCRRFAPGRAGLSSFEEREAVWIEEIAGVGRELHAFMLYTAINCAERRQ